MSAIPAPRVLDPAPALRWGLLGPGWISERFATAVGRHGSQNIVAVGSRSLERAQKFAAEHGIGRAVGSAEELVGLDEVDIVYIGALNQTHRKLAELALNAGKHVLVEKPLAMTVEDAQAIIDLGRSRGLLVMEAMWTRYLPQADVLEQLVDGGAIGDVTFISADFGGVATFDPASRIFAPELGGGALFDAGIYPVSFIASVLGLPSSVQASGLLAPSGVDDHVQVTMSYDTALGAATTSFRSALPVRAVVAGTAGRIEIGPPFIVPSTLSLSKSVSWHPDPDAMQWTDDTFSEPYDALHYQADAAARYVAEGRVESPIHDHEQTVGVIGVLAEARRQLGGL